MSIDEARRLLLHDAARTAWGAEAALVLMEMLPPTGWADVATKADLDHLAEVLRLELRADMADVQRHIIQWNVATIIAVAAVITTVVRLG
jgi:hypothetical protein